MRKPLIATLALIITLGVGCLTFGWAASASVGGPNPKPRRHWRRHHHRHHHRYLTHGNRNK